MPTTPSSVATVVSVLHPNTLSLSDILSITNSIVQSDAPTVITSLPISPTHQATAASYTGLAALGLAIATQIASAIHAAHAAKQQPVAN